MTQLSEEQHDQLTVRCSCGQRVPRAEIEAVLTRRDKVALLDSDSQAAVHGLSNLLRRLKDFLFENCDHSDRDRNYDWCPSCVMGFMEVVAQPSNADSATAMRDKCVEKVEAIHEERLKDLRSLVEKGEVAHEDAEYERAVLFVLSNVIDAIKSLTLDQVKPD